MNTSTPGPLPIKLPDLMLKHSWCLLFLLQLQLIQCKPVQTGATPGGSGKKIFFKCLWSGVNKSLLIWCLFTLNKEDKVYTGWSLVSVTKWQITCLRTKDLWTSKCNDKLYLWYYIVFGFYEVTYLVRKIMKMHLPICVI